MHMINLPTLVSDGASPYGTVDVIIDVEGDLSMIILFRLYTVDDGSTPFGGGAGDATFKTWWRMVAQAPIPSR
jgi:hypothetical protein